MGKGSKRNSKCPCGSGNKYKNCCYDKMSNFNDLKLGVKVKKSFEESRVKKCYFLDDGKCSEKIIKAHSIQNNRILKKISENGCVISPGLDHKNFNIEKQGISMLNKGRKITSVFNGFCSYHDETIFHCIENENYDYGNKKQEFLFAFRAFIYELYKKENNVAWLNNLFNDNITTDYFLLKEENSIDYAKRCYLKIFKEGIYGKKYDGINSFSFVLDKEYMLAVNSAFTPDFDLNGYRINNFSLDVRETKILFLNIFPQENETCIIFSWFKEDEKSFKSFRKISNYKKEEKIKILNNIIITYIENFALNPKLWNNFSSQEQENFTTDFMNTIENIEDKDILFRKPSVNLFRNI